MACAAWPAIRLELTLSNQNEDLWRHGADLAIRVGKEQIELSPAGRCRLNELALAVSLAEAGQGLLYCPLPFCHEAIESGRLVRLLPGWRTPQRPIYAVWPQQQLPRKVRVLLEHLSDFALAIPLLQGETPG
ncbi:LysR substrate-binding domain-containing protein [Crenobacter sp. SG2303]|uniref:LysR substrate-binding domain-containing protein n=1 Tax=Crenobacter oryzisoli TaxID=3056844 RepID=A0ABT7XKZ5_9NEIS|nr:LysR substrate-binding domain-containing protein [Crenobacter sp. SG2303]MDN0074464.1 LysR substrate-binding domain-containing protein [Crenobacter sp. SG2303]